MTRIYIYTQGDEQTGRQRVGHFTAERAVEWDGQREWDGSNNVDVNTRDRGCFQTLLHTAAGRWVLQHRSSYTGDETWHELVDDAKARDWLEFNGYDLAVLEHFGAIAEERGPGRPEIGDRIGVRLPVALREHVRAWALRWDVAEAEAIRRMIATHQDTYATVTAEEDQPKPRVWNFGDPEPEDCDVVRDKQHDVWTRRVIQGEELWTSPDTAHATWHHITKKWGPVTEVPADEPEHQKCLCGHGMVSHGTADRHCTMCVVNGVLGCLTFRRSADA